jgi:hypothetical protein
MFAFKGEHFSSVTPGKEGREDHYDSEAYQSAARSAILYYYRSPEVSFYAERQKRRRISPPALVPPK